MFNIKRIKELERSLSLYRDIVDNLVIDYDTGYYISRRNAYAVEVDYERLYQMSAVCYRPKEYRYYRKKQAYDKILIKLNGKEVKTKSWKRIKKQ